MNEIIGIVLAVIVALGGMFFAGRKSGKDKRTRDDLDAMRKAKENYEKVSRMDDDSQLDEFDRLRDARRR